MSLWAVSYIDFGSNELTTEFVEATDFHDAVFKHSRVVVNDDEWKADCAKLSEDDLRQEFFNYDSMIEAVKVPT